MEPVVFYARRPAPEIQSIGMPMILKRTSHAPKIFIDESLILQVQNRMVMMIYIAIIFPLCPLQRVSGEPEEKVSGILTSVMAGILRSGFR